MTPQTAPPRRPYAPPALEDLGTVHTVTATNCDPGVGEPGPSDSGPIQNPGNNFPCANC
jgi:hypothetical protein